MPAANVWRLLNLLLTLVIAVHMVACGMHLLAILEAAAAPMSLTWVDEQIANGRLINATTDRYVAAYAHQLLALRGVAAARHGTALPPRCRPAAAALLPRYRLATASLLLRYCRAAATCCHVLSRHCIARALTAAPRGLLGASLHAPIGQIVLECDDNDDRWLR